MPTNLENSAVATELEEDIYHSKDCMHVLSCLGHVRLCRIPWTVACQAPLSMGFSKQEYWSGLPFPSSGDLQSQGLNPCLLCLLHWQAGYLPLVSPLTSGVSVFKFHAAVIICSDFGAQEIKSVTNSTFSLFICHEIKGLDAMILVSWMLNVKPAFSLSFFTLIKRLFSSSSLSAIRMVSSAYLRFLIFLPAILIPVYDSSSPEFCMMYSA